MHKTYYYVEIAEIKLIIILLILLKSVKAMNYIIRIVHVKEKPVKFERELVKRQKINKIDL